MLAGFPSVAAVALLLAIPPAAARADEIAKYFGVWADADEGCQSADEQTEGGYFVLDRDFFVPGWGSNCTEVKMWLKGNALRVSTTCEGEEAGFEPYVIELERDGADRLSRRDEVGSYVRCKGNPADFR